MTSDTERILAKWQRLQALRQRRIEAWMSDPARWCSDVLEGVDLADYQAHELQCLPSHGRVAVRGPRGSGKTMPAAVAVLWFVTTRELAGVDWKVPVTAGGWQQLERFTWPEIHRWVKHINWDTLGLDPLVSGDTLLKHRISLDHGEAFAVNSDVPDRVEGAHGDHMLLVVDEGKIVPDGSWDAMEGYFATPGTHMIFAISTPGAAAGRFYDIHARKPGFEDWHPIHVTIDQAVSAGRVSQSWVDARRAQWGEESQAYRCHVLAEFAGEEDGVIPLAWVEAAIERGREAEGPYRPEVVSVDVADQGEDKNVIALRHGDAVYSLESFSDGDPLVQAERAIQRAVRGSVVVVDSIGVGAGTAARLSRESGFTTQRFVASERTKRRDRSGSFRFTNKRSAAWWGLRELLEPPSEVCLPDDSTLFGDLTAPRWREAAGGRIQVESKDEIRKRLGRSTDHGDAVVMAFWQEGRRDLSGIDLTGGLERHGWDLSV